MRPSSEKKERKPRSKARTVGRIGTNEPFGGVRTAILVLVVLATVSYCARGAVDIGVNESFNGTAPKSSETPWVDSFFQDVGPNTVRLTITAGNLSNPEYLQSLYLEFNDTKQVTSLVFTPVFSLWHGLSHDYSLNLNQNGEQASTGGRYDILLGFSTGPGAARRFNRGDQVVFDITTTQAGTSLSSLDFAFRSLPGSSGSFYAAAFMQNTGQNHKDTDYAGATTFTVIGVPEPAWGFAAAGFCIAGLIIAWRTGTGHRQNFLKELT